MTADQAIPRAVRRPHASGRELSSAIVDCALYDDGVRRPGHVDLSEALASARAAEDGFVWIGLFQPDAASLERVAEAFGLPALAVEDAVNAHQRPKLEVYGDTVFLVLKTLRYVDHDEVIDTGEVMIFLGPGFAVTVRHGAAGDLANVRRQLEARPDLLALGPSGVLYAVADCIVDAYPPVLEAVEVDIDEIEGQVFSDDRSAPTERIYKLKRELLQLRRAVEPLGEATSRLAEGTVRQVNPQVADYLRDLHDHVVRAIEQVVSLDVLLDSALSANLAQVSMRQNNDMRKISAWVAIAAVSTLIAGIYGMNFDNMPELRWRYGYHLILGVMAVVSFSLYRGFRRNGWL